MADIETFREVKYSKDYPALNEEQMGKFCHSLAVVKSLCANVYKDKVSLNTTEETFYGRSYIMNWSFKPVDFMGIARGELIPEPEFVEFIFALHKFMTPVKD